MESLRLHPVPLGRVSLALPAPPNPPVEVVNEQQPKEENYNVVVRRPSRFEVVKATEDFNNITTDSTAAAGSSSEGATGSFAQHEPKVFEYPPATPTSETEEVNIPFHTFPFLFIIIVSVIGIQHCSQIYFETDQFSEFASVRNDAG